MNEREIVGEVWGTLNGKGKHCVGLCMCMSVAFLMRRPRTIAWLKAASPLKQE